MTENNEELEFLSTVQVAKIIGCSVPTARAMLLSTSNNCPTIKLGKNYKVERRAFEKWASERHI